MPQDPAEVLGSLAVKAEHVFVCPLLCQYDPTDHASDSAAGLFVLSRCDNAETVYGCSHLLQVERLQALCDL